ncbi:MAG: (2Fe-2S) ferredoxin domain-containing protein [Clostridia bacterium]
MTIEVCIGSACHLRGSHEVISTLKHLISDNGLAGQVELKAVFCMGKCSDGVSVRVDGSEIYSLHPQDVNAFFEEHCLHA